MSQDNIAETTIGVIMAVSAVFWMVYTVAGFNPWELVPGGSGVSIMLATMLGMAAVFDLSAKAGVTCYPNR